MEKTLLARIEQHKDRWSSFGADTGIVHISEKLSAKALKRFAIFQDYDDKFLELISPDVTVALWKKDAVLFEEGSFIDLAFYVQKGEVGVYLTTLGGESISSPPIFKSPGDLSRAMPSAAAPSTSSEHYRRSQAQNDKSVTYLSVMDFDLPKDAAARLGEGEIFGEIGALSGWPQSVTARTLSDCELVQIRLPALRLMKRKSKAFKIGGKEDERSSLELAILFQIANLLEHFDLDIEGCCFEVQFVHHFRGGTPDANDQYEYVSAHRFAE